MTGSLFLDIETVPLAASMAQPYPESDRLPPSNYKSDDAIARWRLTDRAAWEAARAKECSLNPRLGRVVSIAVDDADGPRQYLAAIERDEVIILRQFWHDAKSARGHVVTWNGHFDLRWLLLRSLHYGLKIPLAPSTITAWFRRYSTFPHCDVKAVLTQWEPPKAGEGLSEWAAFFGLPCKTGHGSDVYGMALREEWDALAAYNAQDVAVTKALYHRIAPVYGLGGFLG